MLFKYGKSKLEFSFRTLAGMLSIGHASFLSSLSIKFITSPVEQGGNLNF